MDSANTLLDISPSYKPGSHSLHPSLWGGAQGTSGQKIIGRCWEAKIKTLCTGVYCGLGTATETTSPWTSLCEKRPLAILMKHHLPYFANDNDEFFTNWLVLTSKSTSRRSVVGIIRNQRQPVIRGHGIQPPGAMASMHGAKAHYWAAAWVWCGLGQRCSKDTVLVLKDLTESF